MKTRAHRAWQKLPAMLLSLLFVLSPLTGGTVLSGADSSLSASALDLIEETPGLRAFHDEEGRVAFYGRPMEGAVSAGSPEEAADLWIESRRDALGAGEVDLELLRFNEIQRGRFTVFAYAQWLDGLPVEDARARVLVLNGEEPVVVYAAARLAAAPPDGLPPLGIDGESALASLLGLDEARGLTRWSPPELVVLPSWLAGGSSIEAWKIGAAGTDPATPGYRARTFFVDAASGRLAHARDDIHNIDVTGNVSGMATPGALPDAGGNTPVATDLEAARVRIIGGALVFTDEQGNFVIPNPGSGTVNVTTTLVGPWTEVFNQGGSDLSITEPVLPPGPIDLLFNATPSQFNTAQVNGFFHTVATHEFFKDRAPGFTGLDLAIPCNVNINDACNAFYDGSIFGPSINFFRAAGGCVNTAYSSVVAHEYGHFIVDVLNLSQGAFGEGYGDSMSVLRLNDPVIGRDFSGSGTAVRNIAADNVQFPCSGPIHYCGELLAGCWWDTKLALQATIGAASALEETRQLLVGWSQVTIGGQGDNSAHPLTVIEVLTVDDTDGDIDNGTPHYLQICQGFADHNIDCPPLQSLAFNFPDGIPEQLDPEAASILTVEVNPLAGTPQPGTGLIYSSVDGGPFQSAPMNETSPNLYEAELPALACGTMFRFYVSALDTTAQEITSPKDAPAESYVAPVSNEITLFAEDDFESDQGWTVGDFGDDATTGVWVRVDPIGTAAQPENDHTPAPGVRCWVTGQGTPGGSLGQNDVDDGKTTLKSPLFDLSEPGSYLMSYWRWYSNDTGASPSSDIFLIYISNNGGASWNLVESVGPAGPEASGGWFFREFWVSDLVSPTSQVRLRFVASDEGAGSLVEAAIDDFEIVRHGCTPSILFERGDCNRDGEINVTDAVAMLVVLFSASGPGMTCLDACDADDDGVLILGDVIFFLQALFSGGGPLPEPTLNCGEDPTPDDPMEECTSPAPCP